MSTAIITADAETVDGVATSRPRNALSRFTQAIIRNRKATAGTVILLILVLIAIFPGVIARDDPQAAIYGQDLGPSAQHLLGTTQLGQDVFSQVIWGTRLTLIVTVVVSALATLISVVIGVTAAYIGGLTDRSLSLLTDIFLIIPTLPLLIVLASYLPPGSLTMIVVLTATSWAFQARQLRSQGLSLRAREFLSAAKVRGERTSYIIFVEIIPTMTSLIVASFLGLSVFVVGFAAGLQFLGLGNSTELTWGTMLYYAQQGGALEAGNAWWALAPGAAVAVMGAGFALVNYAFDEIGNPALRPVRKRRARKPA
jgi:peptide/nickel transport system permease protein